MIAQGVALVITHIFLTVAADAFLGGRLWRNADADGTYDGRGLVGGGNVTHQLHDVTERWLRDLPILDAQTHLLVHRRRVLCPRCGPKLEKLSWLDRYARGTRRLAENVARLCALLPIKHVAEFYGLRWDAVKQIDKQHLQETLGPIDLAGIEVIVMDEFAIQKCHRYATVIVDPYTKRVLWVGRGRDREGVRPFFELLGEEGCQRLQAVVMDMNGSYIEEVKAQRPRARSSTTSSTWWPSTDARSSIACGWMRPTASARTRRPATS